jgi:hypothetical protein
VELRCEPACCDVLQPEKDDHAPWWLIGDIRWRVIIDQLQ